MSRPYPPDVCTADEMAYLLSMGKSTFLANVEAGLLPEGVKIGGKRLWIRAHVIEHVASLASPAVDSTDDMDILEAARGTPKETRRAAAALRS